jgi:hypothetical protein
LARARARAQSDKWCANARTRKIGARAPARAQPRERNRAINDDRTRARRRGDLW